MLQSLSLVLLPTLMMFAAASDILSFRIPNWLNALIAACFFPIAFLNGLPTLEILSHTAVGIAMLLVGFALYAKGYFGGGDAKLAAAVGLWFGHEPLLTFLIITSLAGGVLALLMLVLNKLKLIVAIDMRDILNNWGIAESKIPYGVAIAVGAVMTFPQSVWMPN